MDFQSIALPTELPDPTWPLARPKAECTGWIANLSIVVSPGSSNYRLSGWRSDEGGAVASHGTVPVGIRRTSPAMTREPQDFVDNRSGAAYHGHSPHSSGSSPDRSALGFELGAFEGIAFKTISNISKTSQIERWRYNVSGGSRIKVY